MSLLQYKPMGISLISKMVPNLKLSYLNQLKLTWSPLRWNGKMFAAFAVLGLDFGFQVENCIKYNDLLFNLLFLFLDGISRSKSNSIYDKIQFY